MSGNNSREWTRTILCPALNGLELVQARFATHSFPLHAHAETVIGAVLQGAKRSRIGLRQVDVGQGMLTLFNPFDEHTSTGITGSWTFVGLYPPADLIARWFADLGAGKGRVRLSRTVCHDASGAARIRDLYCALDGASQQFEAETRLVDTLDYFFTRHGTLSASGIRATEPGIARVRNRLDDDLPGETCLGDLASISGLPAVKLLRGFRSAFGCTPHVYSTARRLSAAKHALAHGDAIADVALRFGFYDQSHFTRVFRRWTGTSPARFAAAAR